MVKRGERGRRTLGRLVLAARVVVCLAACSCSYNFGSDQPWPTAGAPVDVRGLQHVFIPLVHECTSRLVGYPFQFMTGEDGAPWLVFRDHGEMSDYHLVRLGEPATEERIPPGLDRSSVGRRAITFFDLKAGDAVLHWPGQPGTSRFHLESDTGAPCCSFGTTDDDEVLFWHTQTSLEVRRTDSSYRHSFPLDPRQPAAIRVFDDAVAEVVDGRLRFHSTREERFVDAPPTAAPPSIAYYQRDLQSIIGCGQQGLVRIPIDGGPWARLDSSCTYIGPPLLDPCTPSLDDEPSCETDVCWVDSPWRLAQRRIQYMRPESDLGSPLRVSTASIESGSPLLSGFVPQSDVLLDLAGTHYATMPVDRSVQSLSRFSGPLSIDGRLVAEHGRSLHFSRDGTRVRFLERAANLFGTGQLMAGPIEGPYDPIAHNVLRYDELADGRLIAAVNLVYLGVHNRVVLIDEARREVQPLVEGARDYRLIPGEKEAMVRLVRAGLNEYEEPMDWVRVPLPPPLP